MSLSDSQRTELIQARLDPFLYRLENIDDDDCLAHLNESDRDSLEKNLAELERFEKEKLAYTTIHSIRENDKGANKTFVLEGGDLASPGEEVLPAIPSVFGDVRCESQVQSSQWPRGRRLHLAEWITSKENPWTARVMVNRIWKHHFGRGLVATPDDFGFSGSAPSHLELLDWLAREFVEHDWSIKHLHRLIMRSSVYRQSSATNNPSGLSSDPRNELHWRQNLRRLEAESIRDAILVSTGLARTAVVSQPLWPPIPQEVIMSQQGAIQETSRLQGYYTSPGTSSDVRSIFLVKKRSLLPPFLTAFHMPDGSRTCGSREQEDGPIQAFTLFNNDLPTRGASHLAKQLLQQVPICVQDQVRFAYRALLSREPNDEECQTMLDFLHSSEAPGASLNPHLQLSEVCRAIINSNAFLFID
ncbi:MAG: DUF1553 domain-containing protein [Pirellula sp.]